MFEYIKDENGNYRLIDEDNVVLEQPMQEVAIGFNKTGADLRHGSTEAVQSWFDSTVEAYKNKGFNEMANEYRIVSGKFDLEQLNKLMSITGYLPTFLAFHNLDIKHDKSKVQAVTGP